MLWHLWYDRPSSLPMLAFIWFMPSLSTPVSSTPVSSTVISCTKRFYFYLYMSYSTHQCNAL